MATKGKKVAAKAAPVEAEVQESAINIGDFVKFLGYDADTAEDEQVLVADEVYEVVGVTEADGEGNGGGNPVLSVANPNFNPQKKEHPDTNPASLEVEAFPEEVELTDAPDDDADEVEEVAAAPAPAKTRTKAVAPAKAAAPAKTKAAAPAKAKKVAAPPVEKEEVEVEDETPDLENEDPDVIALIDGSDDLIVTAQELEQQAGAIEWQLGGILYHIKKDKSYVQLEGGEEYAEAGGFAKFLQEYFNIEYRKAMYLIDIYKYFTQAGIEDAAARVAVIGWTKAKTIAKLLTADDAKPDELIELAENNTVTDLVEAIHDQVSVGGTAGERVKRLTLRFRYLEEEAATVNAVLGEAMEQLGLKDTGEALLHIVNAWASEHGGGKATRAAAPKATAAAPAAKRAAPTIKKATAKA